MKRKNNLSFYGMKWNPFCHSVPVEGIVSNPEIENFCFRVEHLLAEGGYGMISGEPGTGKSVALRLLHNHLSGLRDITVRVITRPQSKLSDFYRELGSLFGIELKVSNRFGGYLALREKWTHFIQSTLLRPVLLIDESQEMLPSVLSELRFLGSTEFDSEIILVVVLCGDRRLNEKLSTPELLPLGSRIHTRLSMDSMPREKMLFLLEESIRYAGYPNLMTRGLIENLVDHAVGNLRILMNMAKDLLLVGLDREMNPLDEKLFLEVFSPPLGRKNTGQKR